MFLKIELSPYKGTPSHPPGEDSWHLVWSAIIHVFLGTLQEVFIMLTLTKHEHMLMYLQKKCRRHVDIKLIWIMT